jgi:hypothetical protein
VLKDQQLLSANGHLFARIRAWEARKACSQEVDRRIIWIALLGEKIEMGYGADSYVPI